MIVGVKHNQHEHHQHWWGWQDQNYKQKTYNNVNTLYVMLYVSSMYEDRTNIRTNIKSIQVNSFRQHLVLCQKESHKKWIKRILEIVFFILTGALHNCGSRPHSVEWKNICFDTNLQNNNSNKKKLEIFKKIFKILFLWSCHCQLKIS